MAEFNQKILFDLVMKNNWEGVVKTYRDTKLYVAIPGEREGIHIAKITSSGDTALHIAVSNGREDIVERLIEVLDYEAKDALKIQNEHGNTPLHLAAATGNTRMCECMIEVDENLVCQANEDGHTPLFLTALYGKKDAFIFLYRICKQKGITSSHYRGKHGETILHSAINGEYFELAIHIINLQKELVSCMDEKGMSPLHLLANKPQVFRSCTYFSWLETIVYSCITVKMLPEIPPDEIINQTTDQIINQTGQQSSNIEAPSDQRFPPNYSKCCCFFLNLMYTVLSVIFRRATKKNAINFCPVEDAENPNEDNARRHDQTGLAESAKELPQVSNSSATKKNAKNSGPVEDAENPNEDNAKRHDQTGSAGSAKIRPQGEDPLKFPPNYRTCFKWTQLVYKLMLVILGLGYNEVQKIKVVKEKHVWSVQILEKMLQSTDAYEYDAGGRSGSPTSHEDVTSVFGAIKESPNVETDTDGKNHVKDKTDSKPEMKMDRKETPLLTAARYGIKEIVDRILDHFPVAIHDRNSEKKNVVLLAAENRQPYLYDLLKKKYMNENVFHIMDINGNSALHLAANYKESLNPWAIPGVALQMQWEIKWYEYVKSSMPSNFFRLYNKEGKTAVEVFTETHKSLVKEGGEWLNKTSDSCSVVAALIATVAFATSVSVPGSTDKGKPFLEKERAFQVFSISSLVSLCCSVTSLLMFLAILTSRYREHEFRMALPKKLLWGLSSLLISIAAILVSFCTGHFFILDDQLRSVAVPIYAVTCLPATLFALGQLPLYIDLVRAILMKVPTIL